MLSSRGIIAKYIPWLSQCWVKRARIYVIISLLGSWDVSTQSVHAEQQQIFNYPSSSSFLPRRHLNFSSTGPYLFSSVHGLLRQGYNTFFPNGFVVAPCEIPAFTLLYHGWLNDEPPQSPEWLAFTP